MRQYTKNAPLQTDALLSDPVEQLMVWLEAAREAGLNEPTAMTLATVDADGHPSARVVLFKGLHDNCPTFYTNYDSKKGRALAENPRAALVFWWDLLERQVLLEGTTEKLPRSVSEAYFASRPLESRLSAAVSRQSQPVASREALDARIAAAEASFGNGPIPCPAHWGGYLLRPQRVEFWQGRLGRAHDRIAYLRDDTGTDGWRRQRLEP